MNFKHLTTEKTFGEEYITIKADLRNKLETVWYHNMIDPLRKTSFDIRSYSWSITTASQIGALNMLENLVGVDEFWNVMSENVKNRCFSRAAYNGKLHILKFLHEKGVKGNTKALTYACKFGFIKSVSYLLSIGIEPDEWVRKAAKNSQKIIVMRLVGVWDI